MTVENISLSISTKKNVADFGGGWTRNLLVSSRMAHPTKPPRPAQKRRHLKIIIIIIIILYMYLAQGQEQITPTGQILIITKMFFYFNHTL